LRTLVPTTLDQDYGKLVATLLKEGNELALLELLEGMELPEKLKKRVELIKQAREVSLKLVEYSKMIPLPHRDIGAGYKILREVQDEFDRLGED
jgi:hypothetical protein